MPRFAQIALILSVFTLAHLSASAAVFTVTKTADTNDGVCDSDCSLREALAAANVDVGFDAIVFDSTVFHTPQTIVLTGGDLRIADNTAIAIYGTGASKLTIDGNLTTRIITIGGLANATISGITFTRGNGVSTISTGRAGAVYNYGGTTLITDCVITGNSAANGGGLNNAASAAPSPVSPATLTIINTVVSNNTASGSGGGMQNFSTSTVTIMNSTFTGNVSNGSTGGGGGAFNGGVRITNSTFSGNSAPAGSGGGMQSNGTLGAVLTNVTFTNNSSLNNGGGIHRGTTNVNFVIRNSIVAGNNGTAASPDVTNSAGGLVSLGNNIIGNVGTSTGWIASDLINTDPLLGPFADNGGMGRTHALLSGSPALNAGQNCVIDLTCATNNPTEPVIVDQRAFPRGTDAAVDIGAYESTQFLWAVAPNAALNAPYSHQISNTPGFTFSSPGGLPPGLTLVSNGGIATIEGTPTVAGTYHFPIITVKDSNPTQNASNLHSITVSANPYRTVVAGRLVKFGGPPNEKFRLNLAGINGTSQNAVLSPFGYFEFEIVTGGYIMSISSKSMGTGRVAFATRGSFVFPGDIELAPQMLRYSIPWKTDADEKRR